MSKRRGTRRSVYVVSRRGPHGVELPVAMFASLPRCEEWAAGRADIATGATEYVVEQMSGADAVAPVQENMRFGLRQCYEGASSEEQA